MVIFLMKCYFFVSRYPDIENGNTVKREEETRKHPAVALLQETESCRAFSAPHTKPPNQRRAIQMNTMPSIQSKQEQRPLTVSYSRTTNVNNLHPWSSANGNKRRTCPWHYAHYFITYLFFQYHQ